MSKKPDTPNISAELIDEGSQQLFNESVKECLEVLEGKRGDGLDRALTARDLSTAGVIKVTTSSSDVAGEIAIAVTPVVTDVVEFPTTPTGLTVSGAFTNILLVWDSPTFEGFTSTEVWRYETNLLASSVLVATVEHHMYSEPVNPASTYYYWIRHVNKLNQKGSFNASSGTLGQTSQTVASILSDLNEKIGVTSLDTALSADLATIGTIGTSVTAHTSALGDLVGEQYIKIDGFGSVAGYGISSSVGGSEFAVKADVFKISNGASKTLPFVVTDGVTYINNAMINMATIQWADIPTLNTHLLTVTGPMVADTIDATLLDGDTIIANVSITAPAINGGSITAASINGSTITGGIINGVLVLAGAVALVTEFGAPHYAYDSGVYFDFSNSTNVGGNHLLGVSGNIKPYNYHLYAHSGSTVKNSTSNLFRYRKQSITPEMHCHVQYNQVGGLINANYVALQTHFWVRAGIRTSAGTTLTYSDFAITSFFDGPQQGMRNRQVVQTDSSGIYQYTLNYQFHSSSGSDGFTTYNYHMLGSQTLSIYAAHIGGATGLNFNESTSIKCEAFVQIFNFNGANTSIGTKSIRMHDVADNSG